VRVLAWVQRWIFASGWSGGQVGVPGRQPVVATGHVGNAGAGRQVSADAVASVLMKMHVSLVKLCFY
jgi:hypothetical protein